MSIRIFSRKTLKNNIFLQRVTLIDYSNQLSQSAKLQNGFIKSNSYWNIPLNYLDKELVITTVSDWKDIESWNNWYKSSTRKRISSEFNHIINKEEFSVLKKKLINDDIFLL